MKIIKFADELKNLVHNFLNKYIQNIEQIHEEIKEKEILKIKTKEHSEIKTKKYTLRDLYINFAENLKIINKDLIKNKKINEIFQQFFNINYNKIINIKINNKNINKANFFNNFKKEILNFIDKYEGILLNLNENNKNEVWKKILEKNIEEKEDKFIITDLRYEYENLNKKNSIYILIIPVDKNNNLKIKEKNVLKNIDEVNKDYLKSKSLKEFKEILLSKYNVKKSEELSIAMIMNYYFNKKNTKIDKEINKNFNNIIYFINNFDETKENFKLKINEIFKKINNKNIIYILGGRRTGKDFIANNLIKNYLKLEARKREEGSLTKEIILY